MAHIFANFSFDQSDLNLYRLNVNATAQNFYNDENAFFNGTSYRDVLLIEGFNGGYFASAFGGPNISFSESFGVQGGTISGYYEFYSGPTLAFGVEAISISAVDLYQSGFTPDVADEYNLINNALAGEDTFDLSPYADFAYGRGGNDTIFGNSGGDALYGESGNDFLIGGTDNDYLDGGSGLDTAVYSGNQNSYSLTLRPSSAQLADRRGDGNGTDTLVDVEFLDFDTDLLGTPFDFTNFGGLSSVSANDFESFIELYIAYFNRSPDAIGLNFWGTAFANGTSLEQMATLFVDQDETRTTYPDSTSSTDFVTAVYENVLGRIPDQAGFNFWIDMLNRSEETGVSRDQFILDVLRGVQAGSSDRAFLDSKVDIGAYFAVHRGMSDVDNASAAMALFDGSQASVDQAVAAIDGFYQDALDPNNGEFLMHVVGVLDNPFTA